MTSVRRDRADPVSGAGNTRARYRRILRFAAWHLAVTWWFELLLPRVGLARIAERTRAKRMLRFAQRFHALAVDLGGLMIKVGQFLSSRLDVLPPEIPLPAIAEVQNALFDATTTITGIVARTGTRAVLTALGRVAG